MKLDAIFRRTLTEADKSCFLNCSFNKYSDGIIAYGEMLTYAINTSKRLDWQISEKSQLYGSISKTEVILSRWYAKVYKVGDKI